MRSYRNNSKDEDEECLASISIVYQDRERSHYASLGEIYKVQKIFREFCDASNKISSVIVFSAISKNNNKLNYDMRENFYIYDVAIKLSDVMSIYWSKVDLNMKKEYDLWLKKIKTPLDEIEQAMAAMVMQQEKERQRRASIAEKWMS